ncbi:32960_t:CDS:2, partial [Racocetra persica]
VLMRTNDLDKGPETDKLVWIGQSKDMFFEKYDDNNDEINLVASPRDYYFEHAISDVEDVENSNSKPSKQADQEKSNNLEEPYPKEPDNKGIKNVESDPIREIFNQ